MDDPWGSPWADELHHPIPTPDTKGHGLALHTTHGTAEVTTERTDGPWGEFGNRFEDEDWSSTPVLQDVKDGGEISGGSPGSPSWETGGHGDLKFDGTGVSPHWDRSQAGSSHSTPKLSPILLPKPIGASRQPSPDPWTTVQVSPDGDYKKIIRAEWGQDAKRDSENTILSEDSGSARDRNLLVKVKDTAPKKSADQSLITEGALGDSPGDPQTPTGALEDLVGKEADEASRSSSSPSEHSRHDGIHPESPRTSLEEDTNRPEVQRHVSEKIQVLVEHFDGLAKAQLEEPAIAGKSCDSHRDENEAGPNNESIAQLEAGTEIKENVADSDQDEDDDFGDFEDGQSQISELPGQQEQTSRDLSSHGQGDESRGDPKELSSSTMAPARDFGRVEYRVDTSALDALYPGLKSEPAQDPAHKFFVPDTIPHDSFSTVEERKTWYRLSRYSTLRQHNSGDDENYVRVTWAQSKIREETLKITAKWMEQDRISGRVVLGGDSKDGSLFGWNDPKAAPVPLATAFAEKKGKKKTHAAAMVGPPPETPREWPTGLIKPRASSKSGSPPQRRRRSSTKSSRTIEETKKIAQPPVTSFGWNTESQPTPPQPGSDSKPVPFPSSRPSSQKPSPFTELQTSSGILAPIAPTQQTSSDLSGLNTSLASIEPSLPPILSVAAKDTSSDFDDDWGEMVSSPTIATPPKIPPSRALRHKKSQSLIGVSISQVPTTGIAHPPMPFGNGHRPTASLDKISIPTIVNPATSNTAAMSNSNYDPWALADFSIFESSSSHPQTLKSEQPSQRSVANTFRPATKSVAFQSTRAEPPWQDIGRTKHEAEQDRIVASIVKRLPDLSYMFRR